MAFGSKNARGIYLYGEDDNELNHSALLNKLGQTVSDATKYFSGTPAQRALLTPAPEGATWKDTDAAGRVWKGKAGVWVRATEGATLSTDNVNMLPVATTWQAVVWKAALYDHGGCFASAKPTRLVAPTAGLYRVSATLRYASTVYGGGVALAPKGVVDERTAVFADVVGAPVVASARPHVEDVFELNAGEYVEVMAAGIANGMTLTPAGCGATITCVG